MLTPKFVRAHFISATGIDVGTRWLFKLMYEFWGFCINGGDNLRSAGGFAQNSGVFSMPWSGSADTSLIASGSDGFTQVGMPFFNSPYLFAFSASYVGKHIVTWKSGSSSTDDSVYQITQWINSSTIRVNVLEGGTPYSASLHPSFTTRTNINYRIIDFTQITGMALTTNTSSLVVQFNGAPLVNPGQRLSQARIKHFVGAPGSPYPSFFAGGMTVQLSPSGTFHGPEFSSGSFSSGSVVYANGLQPFAFTPTASIYFTGSYRNLTGSLPNTTTGSLLVGHLTGTMNLPWPLNFITSGTFLYNGQPVVTGTAVFSGTFVGVEGNYALTGTFLPSGSSNLNFSGTYHFSASGVFTPAGTLLPPGFHSESINEYFAPSGNSTYMWNGDSSPNSPAYVTLIGATDFLMFHYKGTNPAGSGFHIEVPQRLYPYEVDPNPLSVTGFGFSGINVNSNYSNFTAMHNPPDNTLINYRGMSRRLVGNSELTSPVGASNGRLNGAYFNTFQNKFLFFDVVLAFNGLGQYQMARTRLRRIRVLPPIIPPFERVGNNGEWIYLGAGVLWPWDNTLLPYNLFLGGL